MLHNALLALRKEANDSVLQDSVVTEQNDLILQGGYIKLLPTTHELGSPNVLLRCVGTKRHILGVVEVVEMPQEIAICHTMAEKVIIFRGL
jgi:hypothetical protein